MAGSTKVVPVDVGENDPGQSSTGIVAAANNALSNAQKYNPMSSIQVKLRTNKRFKNNVKTHATNQNIIVSKVIIQLRFPARPFFEKRGYLIKTNVRKCNCVLGMRFIDRSIFLSVSMGLSVNTCIYIYMYI